ncbi:MAG: hypothetical protein J1E95_10295 [Muribaculaceae bacterium]|nr:hypothetical protein [Muribaculaceae bacterium]
MKKPEFRFSKLTYSISAILSIPLLIDFCTACHLFPLWLAWSLLILIIIISGFRLWFAFSQHCYKFAWGLIGQIFLGAGVLTFFQLSYTNVIETPVSHPETPAVINIASPILNMDSVSKDQKQDLKIHKTKEDKKTKESKNSKK